MQKQQTKLQGTSRVKKRYHQKNPREHRKLNKFRKKLHEENEKFNTEIEIIETTSRNFGAKEYDTKLKNTT